jgi:RimJ/RimL family protein N-acetyltransferase
MSPSFMRASLERRREDAEALIGARLPAEWPDERGREAMHMRLDDMARAPESASWLLRAIVEAVSGEVAGYINFHGPPLDGRAELGYTVLEPHRRRGYATEAALAMMDWAQETHGVARFIVSVSPSNAPSLALAAKLGFERIGSQIDPIDGEEWVFELVREGGHERNDLRTQPAPQQQAT